MVCGAMAGYAQWGVSANMSVSTSNYAYTQGGQPAFNKDLPQGWAFDFTPRIGYAFGDLFSAGVDLGFGYANYNYTDGFYNPITEVWDQSEIFNQQLYSGMVGLFMRLQIQSWGRLSLHAELAVGYKKAYGTNTKTQYAEDVWGDYNKIVTSRDIQQDQFRLQVVPVFHYLLGNWKGGAGDKSHLSADLYLNFISMAYAHTVTNMYGEKSKTNSDPELHSQTVTNDFDLGFRVLGTNPIGIGFTYSF